MRILQRLALKYSDSLRNACRYWPRLLNRNRSEAQYCSYWNCFQGGISGVKNFSSLLLADQKRENRRDPEKYWLPTKWIKWLIYFSYTAIFIMTLTYIHKMVPNGWHLSISRIQNGFPIAWLFIFNPLNPKIKIWILICCTHSFPTEVVGRSW